MIRTPSRGPTRRDFLIFGGTSAAAVAFAGNLATRAAAGAATSCDAGTCTPTTVWMLDPDWGYARGPHAKTRLVSRASRRAAANRVARTEQDALAMNLHECSWAPATRVSVCETRVNAAFAGYGADWTNPWNGATVTLVDVRRLPADQDLFSCPAAPPPEDPPPAPPQDPGASDPGVGDPGVGDPGVGDPGVGDPGVGDPVDAPGGGNGDGTGGGGSGNGGRAGGTGGGGSAAAPGGSGAGSGVDAAESGRPNYPGTVGQLAFTGDTDRRLLFVGAGAVVAGVLLRALGGKTPTPAHEIEPPAED